MIILDLFDTHYEKVLKEGAVGATHNLDEYIQRRRDTNYAEFPAGTRVTHAMMGDHVGQVVDAKNIPIEDRRDSGVPVQFGNRIYWMSPSGLKNMQPSMSENSEELARRVGRKPEPKAANKKPVGMSENTTPTPGLQPDGKYYNKAGRLIGAWNGRTFTADPAAEKVAKDSEKIPNKTFKDSQRVDPRTGKKMVQKGVAEGSSNTDVKKQISKFEELALAANRAGDDAKCKQYQQKIQALKQKMSQGVTEGTKLVADGSVINAYYNGIHIGNIFASNTKDTPYKAYSKHWDMSRLFKSKKAAAEWLAQTHQTAIKEEEEVHNPGMAEAKKKKKKKSSRSLGRYFFPGYGYYGSGESGDGGGDGGGGEGESVNRAVAQGNINELSTDKLAQYKTAAGADAAAADKRGDYKHGDKRFAGIVKATKKQFANDVNKHNQATVKEESSTGSDAVEQAILKRIMVSHTDLLRQFGPDKVMQAVEEVAYGVGDVDEIGTSDVSAYVRQVRQILGA